MLRNGVSTRVAMRTIAELSDHYDDLQTENLNSGTSPDSAGELAAARLGDPARLVQQVSNTIALRSWTFRFPGIARLALPLACILLLPVAPVFAGVANLSTIVRWTTCLLLSALVTATIMFVLQLSITHS